MEIASKSGYSQASGPERQQAGVWAARSASDLLTCWLSGLRRLYEDFVVPVVWFILWISLRRLPKCSLSWVMTSSRSLR